MSGIYDVIIIGGGVAGFSAAMYAGRLKMKTLVIAAIRGGTIVQTNDIANWPGIKQTDGITLATNIEKHATSYEDVSVIDEMPKNRKKIITKVISPAARQKAYDFVEAEAKVGHQTFVICPLIEDKETIKSNLFDEDKKTVVKEAERLQREVFPNLRIAMLHGKLKSQEKEAIMTDFKAKKYDILVSTSVVEVGVDILSATVMMIEDAESFGLAQLHQFRGRVGRSNMQSHCLIFSSSNSENARRRLSYMEKISSGFELAEKDLQLRGPGQMYGYQQSGFWDFSFADIGDRIMIERATEAAKSIASVIDKYSELKKKVGEIRKHLE